MTKTKLAEQMRQRHRDYYRSGEHRRMIELIGLKYSAVDEHMANLRRFAGRRRDCGAFALFRLR